MADQVLTLTYSLTTQKVTQGGLAGAMHASMQRLLTRHGIHWPGGAGRGWLSRPTEFDAAKRASIVTAFDALFDQDPNPAHATDNFSLVFTAA